MEENLTVYDLYRYTEAMIKMGFGDYKIYISSDEEGNSFNPLWYGYSCDIEEIKATEQVCFINYANDDNKDNIVLLG